MLYYNQITTFKGNLGKNLKNICVSSQRLSLAIFLIQKRYATFLMQHSEQAYNLLFNLVELARTNIQKVDPICENLCLPPAQLSFDGY